jgi:hypothetical protein
MTYFAAAAPSSIDVIGRTNLNSAPLLPSEHAVSWPPWRSIIARQIDRPSPGEILADV